MVEAATDGFENPDRPEQASAVVSQVNGEFASTRDSQFGIIECQRIDIHGASEMSRGDSSQGSTERPRGPANVKASRANRGKAPVESNLRGPSSGPEQLTVGAGCAASAA